MVRGEMQILVASLVIAFDNYVRGYFPAVKFTVKFSHNWILNLAKKLQWWSIVTWGFHTKPGPGLRCEI